MKKKLFIFAAVILTVVMAFSFIGCGNKGATIEDFNDAYREGAIAFYSRCQNSEKFDDLTFKAESTTRSTYTYPYETSEVELCDEVKDSITVSFKTIDGTLNIHVVKETTTIFQSVDYDTEKSEPVVHTNTQTDYKIFETGKENGTYYARSTYYYTTNVYDEDSGKYVSYNSKDEGEIDKKIQIFENEDSYFDVTDKIIDELFVYYVEPINENINSAALYMARVMDVSKSGKNYTLLLELENFEISEGEVVDNGEYFEATVNSNQIVSFARGVVLRNDTEDIAYTFTFGSDITAVSNATEGYEESVVNPSIIINGVTEQN